MEDGSRASGERGQKAGDRGHGQAGRRISDLGGRISAWVAWVWLLSLDSCLSTPEPCTCDYLSTSPGLISLHMYICSGDRCKSQPSRHLRRVHDGAAGLGERAVRAGIVACSLWRRRRPSRPGRNVPLGAPKKITQGRWKMPQQCENYDCVRLLWGGRVTPIYNCCAPTRIRAEGSDATVLWADWEAR